MSENPEVYPLNSNDVDKDDNATTNEMRNETSETVDELTETIKEAIPETEVKNEEIILPEEVEIKVSMEDINNNTAELPDILPEVSEELIVEPQPAVEEPVVAEITEPTSTIAETETVSSVVDPIVEKIEEPSVEEEVVAKPARTRKKKETIEEHIDKEITEPVNSISEAETVTSVEDSVSDKNKETSGEDLAPKASRSRKKKETAEESKTDEHEVKEMHDISAEEEEHEIDTTHHIHFADLSKEELIIKLEELVKNSDISKIKTEIAGIKVAYIALSNAEKQTHLNEYLENGGTKEEYIPVVDQLEERFKRAFDIYKESKVQFDHEQEKIKSQNLKLKNEILEEIRQLINSDDSLKKTYDSFKLLQDKWKQVGMVPRAEMEGLWNNYHFLVEKFFEKVKINKELKDLDLKKNLEAKIALCEKAEELLLEKSITKSFKLLQKYHDEWKEIGPVIQDKKDEIWERFKNVSDSINRQRREHYESLQGEQENNLLAKTALCEKVDEINSNEISSNNDWKEKTDQILEMQNLWDSIGRAPIKQNDEIWERFRAAVNLFFNNKKEYFGDLKDQQYNNYNLKLNICVQAESLINSTNWKQSTNEIIKLQQDWKKIGPIPRKFADKVWKRFRTACDDFFAKKAAFFSNIHSFEQENQKKKEEILERVKNYEPNPDKKANLENLKNFQREWVEIGFVPFDVKEKLQNEFKKGINELMDKLKISSTEITTMQYKNRIDNLQNSSDAKNALYKERVFIESSVNKLKSEILQWENNLGFFASSKKADLLKEEFEKKIQGAKQELALLEAKLKMLRNNQ